ncbi:AraC family transcriptional regulator [Xanthobacter pseudotagetidis]|uniref:AraC family transcriptional regulator n=1 Tax=Xanthobacter pseudotagetidis TaxID=3119911 RepID=UPI00372691B9
MTQALGILSGRFGRVALLDMDTSLTVHAHGHCHLVFKVSGPDQLFTVEGAALPLRADTAVAVNSWQEHSYAHATGGERTVFLALYLETDWLADADRLFSLCGRPAFFGAPGVHVGPEAEFWRDRLMEMVEAGAEDACAVEEAIVQLSWAVGRSAASREPRPARAPDFRIRRAMRTMHERIGQPYAYDTLAASAGLSRSRFNALFRESTGVTPAVYGNALRVEASVAALGTRSTSISTVADDLGFSAPSNFCRFFQQHTGLVPRDFRRAVAMVTNGTSRA